MRAAPSVSEVGQKVPGVFWLIPLASNNLRELPQASLNVAADVCTRWVPVTEVIDGGVLAGSPRWSPPRCAGSSEMDNPESPSAGRRTHS